MQRMVLLGSAVALGLAALAAFVVAWPHAAIGSLGGTEFRRGITLNAYHRDAYDSEASDRAIERLAATGANFMGITANFYQDTATSSEVYMDPELTASDEALTRAITRARSLGLRVLLIPHLLVKDHTWHASITTQDPDRWFATYGAILLHYAALAERLGVEELTIGVELYRPVHTYPDRWREFIAQVRQVYRGRLTYGANWGAPQRPEYWQVEFWDALDYVGVQMYPPLAKDKSQPTVEDMLQSWKAKIEDLDRFAATVDKPIVITEVGYRSMEGAPGAPWDYGALKPVDLETQRATYEALFRAWGDRPWWQGVFWWYWKPDPDAGGPTDTDYTPQGKPAEEALRAWFLGNTGGVPGAGAPSSVRARPTCGQRVVQAQGLPGLLLAEAFAQCGLRWGWQRTGTEEVAFLLLDREGAVLLRKHARFF